MERGRLARTGVRSNRLYCGAILMRDSELDVRLPGGAGFAAVARVTGVELGGFGREEVG
jgi:hypothetical protein